MYKKQALKEEDLKRLREFRLLDDDFMTKCFEDNIECTELVVQIVLGRDDIKVERVETQHLIIECALSRTLCAERGCRRQQVPFARGASIAERFCVIGCHFLWHKNLQGRSIILDIYATDSTGKRMDIEIQRAVRGAGAKRARYHSSLMDANITEPGDDLEHLPETYVIFITEQDVLRGNRPVYHIERVIQETGMPFDDEAHILYVKGEYRDDSPLGILIHDFSCTDPDDMKYPQLADRVRYFKEDERGVAVMCKAMEDMRNEAALAEREKFALRLLKDGMTGIEKIAKLADLTVEEVRELERENS